MHPDWEPALLHAAAPQASTRGAVCLNGCFRHMTRIFYFLFVLFGLLQVQALWAQNRPADEQLVEIADDVYRLGARRQALDQYLLALNHNPNNLRANYMAGICYIQTIQKERSLRYLLKAQELDAGYTSDLVRDADLYPDLLYLIGLSYHLGENFDKATQYYTQFNEALTRNQVSKATLADKANVERVVERKIYECGIGKQMMANPVLVRIRSVNELNSPYPDYAPVLDSAQKTMVFTSRRAGGASPDVDNDLYFFEDIYTSTKETDTSWAKPTLLSDITTAKHEASISLSADGNTMLLFKDENGGDIYISRKEAGKWTPPKSLDKTINSEHRETSAWMTANGRFLYFASDRPGGFGGLDLYASESLGRDRWSVPMNLGPKINTEWDDDVPMITANGQTLFFSSKGHKGMGGYDIYKSKFDTARGEWLDPRNMGYPLNTADNDIYYFQGKDSLRAYYSSLKDIGVGDIDIFEITYIPSDNLSADSLKKLQDEQRELLAKQGLPDTALINQNLAELLGQDVYVLDSADVYGLARQQKNPTLDDLARALRDKNKLGKKPPVKSLAPTNTKDDGDEGDGNDMIAVRIAVRDRKTGQLMQANVRFSRQGSNEELVPEEEEPGVYVLRIPRKQAGQWVVTAEKDGYMFKSLKVTVPRRGGDLNKVLEMDEKSLNTPLALRNIYFDFNKSTLKAESERELKLVLRFLKANRQVICEIAGHTDNIGSEEYNIDLSRRRSETVVKWLTARGIDAARLVPRGYGETKPLASNDDEKEGRELNRRTEFEILTDKSR